MIAEIPFSFEEMKWEDVPEVMAIEHRSFTLPWSANTYRHELLENTNGHYYVLRHRGDGTRPRTSWLSRLVHPVPGVSMVGYGGFWLITDEAHISTIAIDVGWRGRGLGEYLLASLVERAMNMRAAQVTLEVREGNLAAQNLYRKYGFSVSGKRPRYYQDNHENALLMTVDGVNTEAYAQEFHHLAENLLVRLGQMKLVAKHEREPQKN